MFEIEEMIEQIKITDKLIRIAYEELDNTVFKDCDSKRIIFIDMSGNFKIQKISINNDCFYEFNENQKLELIKEAVNNVINRIQKERARVVTEDVFDRMSEI